jgi:hypothetical protein
LKFAFVAAIHACEISGQPNARLTAVCFHLFLKKHKSLIFSEVCGSYCHMYVNVKEIKMSSMALPTYHQLLSAISSSIHRRSSVLHHNSGSF